MQVDRIFPIPLAAYDEGILPNNYISFIAYKEQAKLYFHAKNLRSFDLYLNNVKLSAQQLCTGTPVCFDASRYIQNGVNVLYIAGLTPETEEHSESGKPFLQVKIPYPVVLPAQRGGKEADYSIEALDLVDQLLTSETTHGFPGAQLVIVKNGRMVKNAAYGSISSVDANGRSIEKPLPVTNHTLFDIASNTKIYAATFAVQKLISEEKLFLTDTVHQFFPDFVDEKKDAIKGKELITVFDLLTHQSGFPAGGNYARKIEGLKTSVRKQKTDRQHTLDFIMKTPLAYEPRSKFIYSDINFMLLTYIIEKITDMPLDVYVQESFYAPLKLDRICFKPLEKGFQLNEIAATEIAAKPRSKTKTVNRGIKTQPVHGTVHDYDAYVAMEQVSGHAGLFTNAETLAVLAQVMLNNGGYGSQCFFAPSVTGFFTAQHTLISSMGLGWRRQGKKAYTWAFSPFASENTFGHTGWTGTLTLIDPEEHLIIILLTNAKHTMPPSNSRRGRLEGDYYLAKRYGPIATLIYEAFHNPPPSKLDGMLMELAEQKYKMLVEIEAFRNKGYIGDLTAIMETIKTRSAHSELLQAFLNSDTAKKIEAADIEL